STTYKQARATLAVSPCASPGLNATATTKPQPKPTPSPPSAACSSHKANTATLDWGVGSGEWGVGSGEWGGGSRSPKSRGPSPRLNNLHQHFARLHPIPFRHVNGQHLAGDRCLDFRFHLHRFGDQYGLARLHGIAHGYQYLDDVARHAGADVARCAGLLPAF